MLANRRRSERRVCRSFAKIQFATGGLPRDCMITDVSDGGVKIIADYPEIPPEFTVIFSTGQRPRACKLAWRIGCVAGSRPSLRMIRVGAEGHALTRYRVRLT